MTGGVETGGVETGGVEIGGVEIGGSVAAVVAVGGAAGGLDTGGAAGGVGLGAEVGSVDEPDPVKLSQMDLRILSMGLGRIDRVILTLNLGSSLDRDIRFDDLVAAEEILENFEGFAVEVIGPDGIF